WHVYQQCKKSKLASKVVVLTDHEAIEKTVLDFGGAVLMTGSHHPTGTDRLGEALTMSLGFDNIINVQGDEPMIDPKLIDALIAQLDQGCEIVTACHAIESEEDLFDYNVVKVVRDLQDHALYFSRQAIPAHRDIPYRQWLEKSAYFRHLGVYGYKAKVLEQLVTMPPAPLEGAESLEQLRWLSNGYKIKCITTNYQSIGVDKPEDILVVEELMLLK
ncbi:MAG TPA: 3-deoxy-manno-octulosonate cytidylyltransferase, partial [Saprospiraceae bacterium]|nr:3-deoxy-manno-octulosonate cytidylyltransferase [Saprospiraceae bacterium]